LKYTLRKSKFAWIIGTWPIRALIESVLKKVIATQLENAIANFLKWTNTELAFARERFRGARVANPKSLLAWWRAVRYRVWDAPVGPEPNVRVEIGVSSVGTAGPEARARQGGYGKGKRAGVFEGEYAPGSLVAVWEEDVERAGEVVGRYGVVNGGGGVDGAEHVGESRRLKVDGWRNAVFDTKL